MFEYPNGKKRRDFLKLCSATGALMTLPKPAFAILGDGFQGIAAEEVNQRSVAVAPRLIGTDPVDDIKTLMRFGLGRVPVIGDVLSTLLYLLWPVKAERDVWSEIKDHVNQLVDDKIDAAVYGLVKAKLSGLKVVLQLYIQAAMLDDNNTLMAQFISTNTVFAATCSEFQNDDYAYTLSPLFAIFGLLHLQLLRDCALHGASWGWSSAVHNSYVEMSVRLCEEYSDYLDKVYKNQYQVLAKREPVLNKHRTNVYDCWQQFKSSFTILCGDFIELYAYMDPKKYPNRTHAQIITDVYSKAYGTCDNWDTNCVLNGGKSPKGYFSQPGGGIDSIYIEYFNYRPRVVQVSHRSGDGPTSIINPNFRWDTYNMIASRTPRGIEKRQFKFDNADKFNIQGAYVSKSDTPTGLRLKHINGREVELWNDPNKGKEWEYVEYSGRKLTTLNMWSRSSFYDNDLACIIFGFSHDRDVVLPPRLQQLVLVAALEDYPIEFKGEINFQLRQQRKLYWDEIMSYRRK